MRYEYDSKAEYYISTYRDQVGFAYEQTKKQLDASVQRLKEERHTSNIFGGIVLVFMASFPVAILITYIGAMSGLNPIGFLLLLIGVLVLFIDVFSFLFLYPFLINKMLQHYVTYSVCKPNALGVWLHKRTSFELPSKERQECQTYLSRLDHILKMLDEQEYLHKVGEETDFSEIEREIRDVDLKKTIRIRKTNSGQLKKVIHTVTILGVILTYIVIFTCVVAILREVYWEIISVFRQM